MCFVGPVRRSRVRPCQCGRLDNRSSCNSTLRSSEDGERNLLCYRLTDWERVSVQRRSNEEVFFFTREGCVGTNLFAQQLQKKPWFPVPDILIKAPGAYAVTDTGSTGQDGTGLLRIKKGNRGMQVQPPPCGPDNTQADVEMGLYHAGCQCCCHTV